MPAAYSRLRLWFGIAALLLIGVVAGFYGYARYRVARAARELPAKLGIDIQQNTQGFTYSQSVGGRTIYSISAANAVRYKAGSKAELHNVKIVSYGRDADRLDRITGDDFEYNAATGDISAKGQVSIDLQATEPGTSGTGGTPKQIGSPLHLDTSGLTFNQKTGIAQTANLIMFRLPEGSGSAVGATYSSKSNTLDLHSDIRLVTSGPKPVTMYARSAFFAEASHEITLAGFTAHAPDRHLDAEHVLVHLRPDNTVHQAEANGGLVAQVTGNRPAEIHAANAAFQFSEANQLHAAKFQGGVAWTTGGPSASQGRAENIALLMGSDNKIRSAELRGNVDIRELARTNTGSASEFQGAGLDLSVREGRFLDNARSVGPGQIVLTGNSPPNSQTGTTTITAGALQAKFARDNHIASLNGSAPVRIVSSSPGKPERTSDSRELSVAFTSGPQQALEQAVQTGDVNIREGQRTVSAQKATYKQSDDTTVLTANVSFADPVLGLALTCDSLSLNRRTGETVATGNVKTSYVEQKSQASGVLLAEAAPIHVTAANMAANSTENVARYSGGARLWQGANIIQAETIAFDRKQGTLDAESGRGRRVSTVFSQSGQTKKAPVEVTADRLHYADGQSKAVFQGGILLRDAQSTLKADRAVVVLAAGSGKADGLPAPDSSRKASSGSTNEAQNRLPSAVQSIDATGDIVIQQGSRKATGEHLVYTANEGKFVLTGTPGNPPSIFDAEHGKITGVSLTFYTRDDTVLVGSSNSSSISQTGLKK
ncbi:MAG TPA: LPS export ABC transporter periplasmic protein LptC [Terriglobales bacterium]|nr:LPS export ABC transporter periplasmic protein LptC [Terriglobales bacterium]